tara:strand:- start:22 stop:690 length:669 start_codon:yes stop_codon:yes gene_type:complete
MDVVRVIKSKDYTTICNRIFKDKRLSLKAKGLLAMLLSFSDHWDLSIMGLETILKEGRTSIRSTLNELIINGYVEREQIRKNGMFLGVDYTVFESPKLEKPISVKSKTQDNLQVSNNIINNQSNKVNNKNDFYNDIFSFKEYSEDMKLEFFEFWSEPTKKGILKKDLQKTWSTSRRLKTWMRNSSKWNLHNNISKVDKHLNSHNEAMEILKKIDNDNIKNIR